MIVVDTNTIAYLLLSGEYSAVAEQVLQKDNVWAAPLLWRSEFRNVLAGYLRRERLTIAEAVEIMSSAERLLKGNEYVVTSDHVLRLVVASDCSAYDCEFVGLAEDLHVPLVTVDRRVLKCFSAVAVSPQAFI